jgi:hypothetical protein
VVFATSISTPPPYNQGVVFVGSAGTVYGGVTLPGDVTVPSGTTLTVPDGAALTVPEGVTLTNEGIIANNGEIVNKGTIAGNEITGTNPPESYPGKPSIVAAEAGDGQALVTFSPPADNGNNEITGYTIKTYPGGTEVASGTASPITVTGLTNGTAYTFTVRAVNGIGPGPESDPSNLVTPTAPAPAPGDPGEDPDPKDPDDGAPGQGKPTLPDTSSSTLLANASIGVDGARYPIEKQGDGSWLALVPYGTDLTRLALTFQLPQGARCVPASGTAWDFSGGRTVLYTVTSANGKNTEEYGVRVSEKPATVAQRPRTSDATGASWSLHAAKNADGSYGVSITVPMTVTLSKIPSDIYVLLTGLSDVSLLLVDSRGDPVESYPDNNPFLRGAGDSLGLRIMGKSESRWALESIKVERIDYAYSDEPGTLYEHPLDPAVTYENIGNKTIDPDDSDDPDDPGGPDEKPGTSAGGCDSMTRGAIWALFAMGLWIFLVESSGGAKSRSEKANYLVR